MTFKVRWVKGIEIDGVWFQHYGEDFIEARSDVDAYWKVSKEDKSVTGVERVK